MVSIGELLNHDNGRQQQDSHITSWCALGDTVHKCLDACSRWGNGCVRHSDSHGIATAQDCSSKSCSSSSCQVSGNSERPIPVALPGLSTLLPWSTLPPAPLPARSPQPSSPISHTWPKGQPTVSQCVSPPLSAVRPHPASPVRIPWNQHHIPHTFPPHSMPLSPPNSQPHSYGSTADCASSCSSSVGSYSDTASPTMTPRDQQPMEESGVENQNGQTEEGGGKAAKSYLCPICSRPFSRMYNLRTHIERHSVRRTFECDLCPAKFSRSHDLARHRLTHTQERPYTCERCGRRFARRDALRRHDKVDPVTGQKVCAAEGRPKGSGKKRQVNADTTA